MKIRYVSQQDDADPANGSVFADRESLDRLLNRRRAEAAFLARFSGENGFEIMAGIAGDIGCAQFSRSDGEPP